MRRDLNVFHFEAKISASEYEDQRLLYSVYFGNGVGKKQKRKYSSPVINSSSDFGTILYYTYIARSLADYIIDAM